MSRAFVKELDGQEAVDELPERLVSPYPNLVTAKGLDMINAEIARLSAAYAEAQAADDRAALKALARDLRYWKSRQASAELMPEPQNPKEVAFGVTVTIKRSDGRRQTYRLVGEDEADPRTGTLSYVSPLARALMGKAIGDTVKVAGAEAEIAEIT